MEKWIEFEDFEALSAADKIKYVRSHTRDRNTPTWFERLETAWETKSPLAVSAWDWLVSVYWEMVDYARDNT